MPDPDSYLIAWISALHIERVAARAFLDEDYPPLDEQTEDDPNAYTLGRMGRHNVVIAVLPTQGTSSAATGVTNLLRTFKNIRVGLLVGVDGGAPTAQNDIRLGDVVVSEPSGGTSGVFQYDIGKQHQDRPFEPTGLLSGPPMALRSACETLKGDHESDGNRIREAIDRALELDPRLRENGYARPEASRDRLFQSHIAHVGQDGSACTRSCEHGLGAESLVLRADRREADDDPAIFYGVIASADQVTKDAHVRDRLAAESKVLCLEMESAGLMNSFSCLLVRGISDYADSHRDDAWQKYAATTAAAYAKELLAKVAPSRVMQEVRLATLVEQAMAATVQPPQGSVEQTGARVKSSSIRRRLDPSDLSFKYNAALGQRHAGSGQWLLETAQFKQWKETDNSALWLSGSSGCGKTTLSATVIEHLRARSPVLFFYFDFNDSRKQSLADAIRSLVAQAARRNAITQQIAYKLRPTRRVREDQSSTQTLCQGLVDMLRASDASFVVLDGLDECPQDESTNQRQEVLEWIASLHGASISGLRLLITSRPEGHVRDSLMKNIPKIQEISLGAEQVGDDLKAHVQHQLRHNGALWRWRDSPGIQAEIESVLSSKAQGSFLWVARQIEEVEECLNERQLRQTLASLPQSLYATYSRMWERIPAKFHQDAVRLLQFLIYAERPLTVKEATQAIAIEFDPVPRRTSEKMCKGSRDLATICSGFVSIVPMVDAESLDEQTETSTTSLEDYEDWKKDCVVQLSHFSVREYFLSAHGPESLAHEFSKRVAHTIIAKSCVFTLIDSPRKDEALPGPLSKFYHFCARYWSRYVQEADSDEQMQTLALEFYQRKHMAWRWSLEMSFVQENQRLMGQLYRSGQELRYSGVPPLYCASFAGQLHTCETLIALGEKIDAVGGLFGNALQAASFQGRDQIVQLLLHNGANVNAQGGLLGNALQAASTNGHVQIMRQLLDQGAHVNVQEGCFGTALHAASFAGSREAISLLLEHKAEVNAQGSQYGQALVAAICHGHEASARLLLESGAEVDHDSGQHGTALTAAASGGFEDTARLLLLHGANVNLIASRASTALYAAVLNSRSRLVRLLLQHHADPNIYKAEYTPLLTGAASRGHLEIVQLLLEHGAKVNTLSKRHGTAIMASAHGGHLSTVQLLLQHGGDAHTEGGEYGTTLVAAVIGGSEEVVQLLLELKVGLNGRSQKYGTALGLARKQKHAGMEQLLLAHGACDE